MVSGSRTVLCLALGASLSFACVGGPGDGVLLIVDDAHPATRVQAAISDGPALPSVDRPLPASSAAIGRVGGRAAAIGEAGVFVLDSVDGALVETAVLTEEGTLAAPGAIRAIAARESGGSLLAGVGVLYNDSPSGLLRSPLSEQLAAFEMTALEARGEGDGEEVWFLSPGEARLLAGGALRSIVLENVAPPGHVLALAPRAALLISADGIFSVALDEGVARREVASAGTVHGVARLRDGRAYLAGEAGLFERDASGAWTRHDFGVPVTAVVSDGDRLFLIAGADLVERTEQAFTRIGVSPPGEGPIRLAVDARRDVWVLRGATVRQVQRSGGISFAQHVVPFLDAHCISCHAGGLAGAPEFDLLDFELATVLAGSIARRLTDPSNPMPPRSSEELAPADYAAVLQWLNGGMLP